MNWAEFWQMGGYARFVWPSFGLVLGVLLWQGLGSVLELRRAQQVAGISPTDDTNEADAP